MWTMSLSRLLLLHPVFAEGSKAWERFLVLNAVRRGLAGDDIVDMTDRETFDLNAALPRVFKMFNAVGCEDQVEIEWPVLKLDEIFSTFDLGGLRVGKGKSQCAQRCGCCFAIGR